jgi:hypothetical protein
MGTSQSAAAGSGRRLFATAAPGQASKTEFEQTRLAIEHHAAQSANRRRPAVARTAVRSAENMTGSVCGFKEVGAAFRDATAGRRLFATAAPGQASKTEFEQTRLAIEHHAAPGSVCGFKEVGAAFRDGDEPIGGGGVDSRR